MRRPRPLASGSREDLWLIWEGQAAESCELNVFYSDFFLSSKCHVSPQKWTSLTTPELAAWLDCHNNKKSPSPKRSWTKLSDGEEKEQFLNSFCEIQRRIEKGLLEKAVSCDLHDLSNALGASGTS
jgi:hypothetical protein